MRTLEYDYTAYVTVYGTPYPIEPYPQNCTCQRYPTHQALDCHVHNDSPIHLDDEAARPCTCGISAHTLMAFITQEKSIEPHISPGFGLTDTI